MKETELLDRLLAGETRALAKAITLVESSLPTHRSQADALLHAVLPHTGGAIRLGISGSPGVGKSTFIESFGLFLVNQCQRKLAVLAVDPSSTISGGSILGDKTRMERLSVHPAAYIRPSPARGTLGGVAAASREALLLCEAAGYDFVIVETVGVGQSEVAVAGMTDMFVLLQLPTAGDDLQAIKKGVVELADLVVFNKVDLDEQRAALAMSQMRGALSLLRSVSPHWQPSVLGISALNAVGIDSLWETVQQFVSTMQHAGVWQAKRHRQAIDWTWALIEQGLQARFKGHAQVRHMLPEVLDAVQRGELLPNVAATTLLNLL